MDQILNSHFSPKYSQLTSHSSPFGASYGMSVVSILEKNPQCYNEICRQQLKDWLAIADLTCMEMNDHST